MMQIAFDWLNNMAKKVKQKVVLLIIFFVSVVFIYWHFTPIGSLLLKSAVLLVVLVFCVCLVTPTKNCNPPNSMLDTILVQLLLGFEHDSPNSIAHHWVLIPGFMLEGIILYSTLYVEIPRMPLYQYIIVPIIFCLITHQILIFRNFSVAEKHGNSSNNLGVSVITFFIFIGIGVVSGEFGYLFAISKLAHIGDGTPFIQGLINFMHTEVEQICSRFPIEKCLDPNIQLSINPDTLVLKYSLKGLFVLGTIMVCSLVIFWDIFVIGGFFTKEYFYSSDENERKNKLSEWIFEKLWLLFILMDIFSLLIWIVVATLVIPSFDFIAEEWAQNILVLLVAFYTLCTGYRMFIGYFTLKNSGSHTSLVAI